MSEAPERIWAWPAGNAASTSIYSGDDVDTHGLVSYTRSDLCDRDAIRAEAFEEAAKTIEEVSLLLHKQADEKAINGLMMLSAAIRAKAEGGNRT